VTKDRRLGRGLAALLGTPIEGEENGLRIAAETIAIETSEEPTKIRPTSSQRSERSKSLAAMTVSTNTSSVEACDLDVTQIDANPFQPRRQFNEEEIASLAESLKFHTQLQPILVRRVGGRFQLISGERRLRATIHAGLPTIRVEIREADDRLVAELAIIENLQRKDLNAIEKAMSFKRYIHEHGSTQEELANRLKIDRSTVANFMRLLELPPSILESVQKDELSASHAKAILSLSTEEQQLDYARNIRIEGWSVRETERRVADQVAREEAEEDGSVGVATRAKKRAKSEQIAALEQSLKRQLGTKVEINQTSRGRGRIVIHFANVQEFERLRAMMESGRENSAKSA